MSYVSHMSYVNYMSYISCVSYASYVSYMSYVFSYFKNNDFFRNIQGGIKNIKTILKKLTYSILNVLHQNLLH